MAAVGGRVVLVGPRPAARRVGLAAAPQRRGARAPRRGAARALAPHLRGPPWAKARNTRFSLIFTVFHRADDYYFVLRLLRVTTCYYCFTTFYYFV